MAPKEAITRAKSEIADLFADEGATGIRLEEIRFDERSHRWLVTIGFDRPSTTSERHTFRDLLSQSRNFKVVAIRDETGQVQSVTNWTADRE